MRYSTSSKFWSCLENIIKNKTNKVLSFLNLAEVDISKLDAKKNPREASSLLELMIMVIMKNFALSSKEAVALLSNDSKYLAHLLAKGLKGKF